MADVAGPAEVSLVDRIAAGDDTALAAVYDQFAPVVYGVAARMVGNQQATDICQEVFVALWDHPERFDPGRGNLRMFLVTISRRRCIDHLRRHGRRESTEERAQQLPPVSTPDVDEAAIALIAGQRVRGAMSQLPEPQQRAIELAYFDGLSFRQVATATGVSEGTAKSRIRLGLQRLALEMRSYEEVEPR